MNGCRRLALLARKIVAAITICFVMLLNTPASSVEPPDGEGEKAGDFRDDNELQMKFI